MARNMRRIHDAAFKTRVALEAIRGEKTIAQVAAEYGAHPNQVRQWRQKLLEELPQLFSDRRKSPSRIHAGNFQHGSGGAVYGNGFHESS